MTLEEISVEEIKHSIEWRRIDPTLAILFSCPALDDIWAVKDHYISLVGLSCVIGISLDGDITDWSFVLSKALRVVRRNCDCRYIIKNNGYYHYNDWCALHKCLKKFIAAYFIDCLDGDFLIKLRERSTCPLNSQWLSECGPHGLDAMYHLISQRGD